METFEDWSISDIPNGFSAACADIDKEAANKAASEIEIIFFHYITSQEGFKITPRLARIPLINPDSNALYFISLA